MSIGYGEAETVAKFGWPGPALGWPTDGRPAIESDLVGKRICWNDGGISVFGAHGQFANGRGSRSSWSILEPGTVQIGSAHRQFLILPDGTVYSHRYICCSSIDGHREFWGKVCN